MLDATIKTGAGQSSVTFYANRCSSLYKEDLNEVRVNALFGLNLIKAFYRIAAGALSASRLRPAGDSKVLQEFLELATFSRFDQPILCLRTEKEAPC